MMKLMRVLFWVLALYCTAQAQTNVGDVIKRAKPAVVGITTFDANGDKVASGSGFFLSKGTIITNLHVIRHAQKAKVTLSDESVFNIDGILAIDEEWDLAMIHADLPASRKIAPLSLASKFPVEGDAVIVIGNPEGLTGTVSNGIVSAIRTLPEKGSVLQITAPISHGSSGGPVLNADGEVVGVASFMNSAGQNLNFAVPYERVELLKAGEPVPISSLDSDETGTPEDANSMDERQIRQRNISMFLRAVNSCGAHPKESELTAEFETAPKVLPGFALEHDRLDATQARKLARSIYGAPTGYANTVRDDGTSLSDIIPLYRTLAATMEDSLYAEVVHSEIDLVSLGNPKETFRPLYKGWTYGIAATATDRIKDLDIEVYEEVGDDWVLTAKDDKVDKSPLVFVTPSKTANYRIVISAPTFADGFAASHYCLVIFHQ